MKYFLGDSLFGEIGWLVLVHIIKYKVTARLPFEDFYKNCLRFFFKSLKFHLFDQTDLSSDERGVLLFTPNERKTTSRRSASV